MSKDRVETVRVNLHMTREAAELLKQLAPSENKQGHYLSELVRKAAQEAGLIEAGISAAELDLTALQLQLQAAQQQVQQAQEYNQRVQTHYEDLLSRITHALEQQVHQPG